MPEEQHPGCPNREWTEYTGAIYSLAEGKNVFDYSSVDNVGNVEETKLVEVKKIKKRQHQMFLLINWS